MFRSWGLLLRPSAPLTSRCLETPLERTPCNGRQCHHLQHHSVQWCCWRLHCWSSRGSTAGLSATWSLIRLAARSPTVSRARRAASSRCCWPFAIPRSCSSILAWHTAGWPRARAPFGIAVHPRHSWVKPSASKSDFSGTRSSTVLFQQAAWEGMLRQVRGHVHSSMGRTSSWLRPLFHGSNCRLLFLSRSVP